MGGRDGAQHHGGAPGGAPPTPHIAPDPQEAPPPGRAAPSTAGPGDGSGPLTPQRPASPGTPTATGCTLPARDPAVPDPRRAVGGRCQAGPARRTLRTPRGPAQTLTSARPGQDMAAAAAGTARPEAAALRRAARGRPPLGRGRERGSGATCRLQERRGRGLPGRGGRGYLRMGAWFELIWGRGLDRGRGSRGAAGPRGALCTAVTACGDSSVPSPLRRGCPARPSRPLCSAVPRGEPRTAPRGPGQTEGTRAVPSGAVPRAGDSRTGHPSAPGAPEPPAERPMAVPRQVGGGSTGSGTRGGLCHSCHCGHRGHGASNAPRAWIPCTPQLPGPCVGLHAPPTPRDGCRALC